MIFLKIALVFELSTCNLEVTVGDHFENWGNSCSV